MLHLLDSVPGLLLVLDVGQFIGSPGAGAVGESLPPTPATEELYDHVQQCASRAHTVRAKFYILDAARVEGTNSSFGTAGTMARAEERLLDYGGRLLPCLATAGFEGWYSIVYEGQTTGDDFSSKGLPAIEALPLAIGVLRRGMITEGGAKL
eukprot:SAG11_NODE_1747_length_4330_cov_2.029307_2_plen_152_part_00